MKFWKFSILKTNCYYKTGILSNGITFEKIIAFQIFNDLCVSRKWRKLKIFKNDNKNMEFLIIGIIPAHSEHMEIVELFIPIPIAGSIVQSKFLCDFSQIKILNFFVNSLHTINFGFIDWDSTISYYRICEGIKKTTGPFL